YGLVANGWSRRVNQVTRLTPEDHMRKRDSATHRPSSATGTPPGSGGLLSHANSVTQKRTGPVETMFPASTAASSTLFISGRRATETSSACGGSWDGPPAVYGSIAQMSKCTCFESSSRMNVNGAIAVEIPN